MTTTCTACWRFGSTGRGLYETEVARRRQAEETLRRREMELGDFVENAAEGLHGVADDGTLLWANRAELDMLGYSFVMNTWAAG